MLTKDFNRRRKLKNKSKDSQGQGINGEKRLTADSLIRAKL